MNKGLSICYGFVGLMAMQHGMRLICCNQSINQSIQSIQLISVAASNSSWACAALIMTSTAILPEVSHGL